MNDQDKDLIVFDPKEIETSTIEGGKFVLTSTAEEHILRVLAFRDKLDEYIESIKETLGKSMDEHGFIKIQGGQLSASKRFYGERYEVVDRDFALGQGLANEETKVKVDPAAVEAWIKKHGGQVPDGIKLRDRVEKVSIIRKKGGNDGSEPET